MKSGWVTKKLGEVCEVTMGASPDSKSYNSNRIGLPFYQGKTEFGKEHPTPVKWCNEPVKVALAGDVLLSVRAPIGPVNFANEKCCIGRGLAALRFSGEQRFLYYLLQANEVELDSRGTGTTFKCISGQALRSLPIPIPPLAEQKRIVAKIDAAFEKIDALKANAEKNLANAKELFQSALDEAMRPKKGWVEKRLGEVCEILDSQRIPITKKDRKPGKIPYYGATKQVDSVSDYIFNERLLLLGEDGADWSAGANSAYIIEGKSWVNNHAHVLRPIAGVVNDVWLMFYLNATDLTKWVSGTTVPKLNQKNMCEIPVPIPPINEQEILAKRIELFSSKLETLQQNYARQIADCAEMRQAILREAFEGRL